MIRRFANFLLGAGPWRLASFEAIVNDRTSYRNGIHRAEDFTGIVHSEPGESAFYPSSPSLLEQNPTWEMLPGGPRYSTSGLAPTCPRTIYSLTDAGVITSDGLVYCRKSRRLIAETARRWTAPAGTHPILEAIGYPPAKRVPGLTLSLLTLSGEGFYHLLLESIPRLALLRPWLDRADHVLCAGGPESFHAKWLALAGVPAHKMVWMQGLCHVVCDQLLFTSSLMRDQQPSEWTVAAIRGAFPSAPPEPSSPRRIWISRQDATLRNLSWENELLARLPGFSRIELAELPPAEQIRLASGAEVLAGPHGAGLAHALFGRSGARLIELFPHCHRQPIYGRLAALASLDYRWAITDFDQPHDLDRLATAILASLPPPP